MKGKLYGLLAASICLLLAGCDATSATETAEACVANDLIGQCPVGSNPVLGAEAEAACGGSFELKVIEESGAATGQCQSAGACDVLCQYESPCTCGVAELSKDRIVCAECPAQSCGDGRCEGTERAFCEAGQQGCFPCLEDCGGTTCGDGDCTGSESPETCPQDCAASCAPGAKECLGTEARVCAANGSDWEVFDCASVGLVCAGGECVNPGVCGNGLCDAGEDPNSCPQDCATSCQPGERSCEGNTLKVCAADGSGTNDTDCAAQGLICAAGECVPAGVCPNGLCEEGEDETSCPQDCAIVCGDGVCDTGEQQTCPDDCVECGDGVCGAGEQDTCPQDCGVCIPGEKACFGALLEVCAANGQSKTEIDCGAQGMTCGNGTCVPAGECGNGACEAGELSDCAQDCQETCGNGFCAESEDFNTCAKDCPPECGDGLCSGFETTESCPSDCLASCGNDVCDPLEDRDSCAKDCGWCGNGVCEDGFETPLAKDTGGLESCPIDCVSLTCGGDEDCEDGIACTDDICMAGSCVYEPNDAGCDGGKCLGSAATTLDGCCADADEDDYADAACGGSDCDDGDAEVHPGAYEVCGGVDANCSGSNSPGLSTAVKVTTDFSPKSQLRVVAAAGVYFMTWIGNPAGAPAIEYAIVDPSGALVAGPSVLFSGDSGAPPLTVGAAYSDDSGAFAVAWNVYDANTGAGSVWLNSVDLEGQVLREEPLYIGEHFSQAAASKPNHYGVEVGWFGGNFVVTGDELWVSGSSKWCAEFHTVFYLVPDLNATTFQGFGTDPTLSPFRPGINAHVTTDMLVVDGALTIVQGKVPIGGLIGSCDTLETGSFHRIDTSGAQVSQSKFGEGTVYKGEDGSAVWDGQAYGLLATSPEGMATYQRTTASGQTVLQDTLGSAPLATHDITYAPDIDPGAELVTPVVAGLVGDSMSLSVFVRADDGSEALPLGKIVDGTDISSGHLFWDGFKLVAFYLSTVDGLPQVHMAPVGCQ